MIINIVNQLLYLLQFFVAILNNNSIIIPSKIPLTYHNFHNLQNLAKWKDQRLDFRVSKGLIEILQNAGFTIEKNIR